MEQRWRAAFLIIFFLVLGACGEAATEATIAPASEQAEAPSEQSAAQPFAGQTLTLVTHDSFAISDAVIAAFEAQTGATVQILEAGDAGAALNKSILAKGAPLGDVQFGVDNTFLSRALAEDIFEPYAPAKLEQIPDELKLDPEQRLIPIDYGYVNINYDKAALAELGLEAPTDLRELTEPQWRGQFVVENPATSSPGLAFLLATINYFGDEGDYTWRDFWRDLRNNDVVVTSGWEEAYYGEFSGGGDGTRPLVVSYATSPAAAVIFSETPLDDAPTGNVLPPGGTFRQIEFAGILHGTQNRELAEAWMDFMLSETFQNDIAGHMFVYPVLPGATTPPEFAEYADVPEQPADLDPQTIAANRDNWIETWTDIVLR